MRYIDKYGDIWVIKKEIIEIHRKTGIITHHCLSKNDINKYKNEF